jgi:hypothetical protein
MFTENFKEQLLKLKEKLDEISSLPHTYECGETFIGIDFDESFIYYKTETYYSGCGTENYSFDISWDEIDEPIDYFRDKFQKEFEAREKSKKQNEAKIKLEEEKRERAKLKELQNKYGVA